MRGGADGVEPYDSGATATCSGVPANP
jgi:hypothetical protein